ncbi:MAG: HAMP domain-containing sensor histidine kinase [Bacteroidota bacterium]
MAGSVTDITDTLRFEAERAARERTEEALRLKTVLLNNMSHELRTPLTGILGFSGVLVEEAPPDLKEFAHLIDRSARRLQDTLNSVLDLARLESGALELQPERLDVLAEAQGAGALLEPVAKQRGLSLSVQCEAVQATLDRGALHRVLYNLVGNALKFTEEGEVWVEVGPGAAPRSVVLCVSDTGIGIDEAFLPKLYEEFEQASVGLEREHEGSGLGLAITKRLVSLMGGRIEVESEVGAGTTFSVTLPAEPPAA